MSIRLTDEMKVQALKVAKEYNPLEPPLLVGSCVWLGEGHDIDVVVFVKDPRASCGGDPCCPDDYTASWPNMRAYRHGVVNVIAVANEAVWHGWVFAHRVMPAMPKEILEDKDTRVKICEVVRHYGGLNCLSA